MRKEKALLLGEVKDKVKASKAMIVARYAKLEPNATWQLRSSLAKEGSILEMVKKRVFLKALEGSPVKLTEEFLAGHIGVVFVDKEDIMPTAKVLFKFAEDHADVLTVLCGQIEGKMMPGADVEVLSKLPSLDEMRAIMLGLFTSPMAQMLSVMEAKVAEMSSENKS
jgi:large subunit ribosomal protein L10